MGKIAGWFLIYAALCAQPLSLVQDYGELTDPGWYAWIEAFAERVQRPTNLYNATVEDLTFLPWISEALAREILAQLRKGHISRLTDVCRYFAAAWQCDIFQRLFTLQSPKETRRGAYRLRFEMQFPTLEDIRRGKFLGDNPAMLQQVIFAKKPWWGFFQLAKDTGELLEFATLQGALRVDWGKWRILLGNFGLRVGMGNVLWYGWENRKGMNPITPVLQFGFGSYPYRSSFAGTMWRGISIERSIAIAPEYTARVFGWVSLQKRDGRVEDSTGSIRSVNVSGYFRSPSEIRTRHTFEEFGAGIAAEIRGATWQGGIAVLGVHYDHPFQTYSRYAPALQRFGAVTAFASWGGSGLAIGAELSMLSQGQLGVRVGYQRRVGNLHLAFGGRYFSPAYRAPWGRNFGQWSPPGNEVGWYTGVQLRSGEGAFYLYGDVFRTLQPPVFHFFPITGMDFRIGWRQHTERLPLWFEFRGVRQLQDRRQGRGFILAPRYHFQGLAQLRIRLPKSAVAQFRLLLKASFERSLVAKPTGYGVAIVSYGRIPLDRAAQVQLHCQLSGYATSDAVLWIWEPDVQYRWRIAALAARGIDVVGMLRWRPENAVTAELRWKYRERWQGRSAAESAGQHTITLQAIVRW